MNETFRETAKNLNANEDVRKIRTVFTHSTRSSGVWSLKAWKQFHYSKYGKQGNYRRNVGNLHCMNT